jgi:hypothetical protein
MNRMYHPSWPTLCRGSREQVANSQVSLEGDIACAVCLRVVRALRHPGSRLYAIVPAHKPELAKVSA